MENWQGVLCGWIQVVHGAAHGQTLQLRWPALPKAPQLSWASKRPPGCPANGARKAKRGCHPRADVRDLFTGQRHKQPARAPAPASQRSACCSGSRSAQETTSIEGRPGDPPPFLISLTPRPALLRASLNQLRQLLSSAGAWNSIRIIRGFKQQRDSRGGGARARRAERSGGRPSRPPPHTRDWKPARGVGPGAGDESAPRPRGKAGGGGSLPAGRTPEHRRSCVPRAQGASCLPGCCSGAPPGDAAPPPGPGGLRAALVATHLRVDGAGACAPLPVPWGGAEKVCVSSAASPHPGAQAGGPARALSRPGLGCVLSHPHPRFARAAPRHVHPARALLIGAAQHGPSRPPLHRQGRPQHSGLRAPLRSIFHERAGPPPTLMFALQRGH